MKKCPLCGNENEDINSACSNCGTDLGYQNQALYEVYKRVDSLDKNISAIKGWVTFLGILALIDLIFGLMSGCGALIGL